MEELKYIEQAKKFIEDRGFSGMANQPEVEGLMSAFAHKLASDGDLADVRLLFEPITTDELRKNNWYCKCTPTANCGCLSLGKNGFCHLNNYQAFEPNEA